MLFWIFGGAFVLGDDEELGWYDGAKLAKDKNVVVVSPNYRVVRTACVLLQGSIAC